MPDNQPTSEKGGHSALDWFEVVATVLLALATVATAWSGYQATRWGGEQAKASSRVNALRISAARAADLANSQTQVDIATFIQWVDSYALQETELEAFYRARFREEFRPAVEAWIAEEPLQNPDAPLTPFAMPQYVLAASEEAARLDVEAEVKSAEVRRDIQRQSNYVLGVVLFAAALFFAGLSTKVSSRPARRTVLVLGCIVFLATLAWIATFPISVAV